MPPAPTSDRQPNSDQPSSGQPNSGPQTATPSDYARQSLGVILAVLAPLLSNAPAILGTGRSIGEQSDMTDTLLVPLGFAFSIWGPIFAGIIAWSVIQGLPANRTRTLYRATGWWVAAALALISAWSFAASFPPLDVSRWLTAFIFVPAVLTICIAAARFARSHATLTGTERYLAAGPVCLLAGWCSLAVFLNWAQLGVAGPLAFGLGELTVCLLTLALALAWIAFVLHRTMGSAPYAFAPIWGLGFLAYARFAVDDIDPVIGGAAVIGIAALFASAVIARRARV